MHTRLDYIIVASGEEDEIDAFRTALTEILKNPPAGVEVNEVETRSRVVETAKRLAN